jgi:hypothetical protein
MGVVVWVCVGLCGGVVCVWEGGNVCGSVSLRVRACVRVLLVCASVAVGVGEGCVSVCA